MNLVARAQLNFVEQTLADFIRPLSVTRPIALLQAQHVAIVVSLRAIGHVLKEVDADTPAKQVWLANQWPRWQAEPIFTQFIKPSRDNFLKEFRGFLDIKSGAFGSPMAVADPTMPTGVTFHVNFDPENLLTTDQRKAVPLLRHAVRFWDERLKLAEQAFMTAA